MSQPLLPALSQSMLRPFERSRWRAILMSDARMMTALVLASNFVILLLWRQFMQIEVGDPANWDYMAQAILRGQIPYRDAIANKAPLAAYLSAAAMFVGNAVGIGNVLAARLFQMLLVSGLAAITFLLSERVFRNRIAALMAALMPLTLEYFVRWTSSGTEAKMPMMFFGMLALLLIAKERPFWAGFCGMLSFLCWQPGLLFAGVAGLAFSDVLRRWRDGKALRVVAGALVPLVVTAAYFFSVGALDDLWAWTMAYNAGVFAPAHSQGLGASLSHIWKVTGKIFGLDSIIVLLSLAAFVRLVVRRIRELIRDRSTRSFTLPDGLLVAPLVYFVFCLINFQAGPDLIPFFPFLAIFGGWMIVEIATWLARFKPGARLPRLARGLARLPEMTLAAMLLIVLVRGASYRGSGWTYKTQQSMFQQVTAPFGPDDKIFVHGTTELLVLLNRPNLNPYLLWDMGKDDYVAAKHYGGSFAAIIDELEAQAPRLVALSRLKNVRHAAELQAWVDAHYDRLDLPGYDIYLRKP